jgi:hypothetical protein
MPTSAGQQAEWAINPLDKERWLKIAEHWLQMAQEATTHQGTGVLHEAAFEMTRPPTEAAYSLFGWICCCCWTTGSP